MRLVNTITLGLLAILAAFAVAAEQVPAADAAARPNIIIILADDLGYGDLGCYGSQKIRTPHLDRMSAEGMRFTSFYTQPFCGPCRSALMTGCYPLRLAEVGNRKHHMPVPHVRETLLPEMLQRKGFATAQIGKWDIAGHLPDRFEFPQNAPLQRGFDFHFGTPASNDFWDKTVMMRDGAIVENPVNLAESTTKRYADETIRFIRERRGQPFFIYLCPNMPHTALHAGTEFRNTSPRGLYGDVVEELDHHVGRILETLRSEGLDKNTLVFFTSDNGPWLLRQQDGGSAGPLRGGKTSSWEGGFRVPAIAWAPGHIAPGQTCTRIASALDVFPTCAKLVGATLPEHPLDGRDISAWLLKGPPSSEDDAVFYYHVNTHLQAVRQGRWKLHLPRPYPVPWLSRGIQRAHVDDADRFEIKTPLLFDLTADVGEQSDVAAQHPEVTQQLLALADKSRAEIGDYDRVGTAARFFDPGPHRPDMHDWQRPQEPPNKQNPPAKPPTRNPSSQQTSSSQTSLQSQSSELEVLDEKFDGELSKDWFWSLGTWTAKDGVLRGYESGERRHGPVTLRKLAMRDGVVECGFRLEGKATFAGLIFNGPRERGHLMHVVMGREKLMVIAHPKKDEKLELLKKPVALDAAVWHQARVELRGDALTVTVNDNTFTVRHACLAEDKSTFGFSGDSGGPTGEQAGALEFRQLRIIKQP